MELLNLYVDIKFVKTLIDARAPKKWCYECIIMVYIYPTVSQTCIYKILIICALISIYISNVGILKLMTYKKHSFFVVCTKDKIKFLVLY